MIEQGPTFGPVQAKEIRSRLLAWSEEHDGACAGCGAHPSPWQPADPKTGLCPGCWINETHPAVRAALREAGMEIGTDDTVLVVEGDDLGSAWEVTGMSRCGRFVVARWIGIEKGDNDGDQEQAEAEGAR